LKEKKMFKKILFIFAVILNVLNVANADTYRVIVGWEDKKTGAEVNKMYPEVLQIHPGDTVHFKQNAVEIHTVTLHPSNQALPDLLINGVQVNPVVSTKTTIPDAGYDGTYVASSGVMSSAGPNNFYDVKFSTVGVFKYGCSVHGIPQNGTIIVVPESEEIPAPGSIGKAIRQYEARLKLFAGGAYKKGLNSVPKSVSNGDGTRTFYIKLGYMTGPYEFLRYFPDKLEVAPGDKVSWIDASFHTVSFYNDLPIPDLIIFDQAQSKLVLNPAFYTPAQVNVPLTRSGYTNSGLLVGGASFTLTIGDIKGPMHFFCFPHHDAGMHGMLMVHKRN
jgi:plastocyanin